jgi:hypothetical protein
LRFISGKYQGGEFPLTSDRVVVIGRSSDLDMVLVEDMVSRKHACITMQADGIWIEDLGSTNGTFVNGEKVKRASLKEGDRILIGTSILKLAASDGLGDSTDVNRQLENVAAARRTSQARSMSGSIEEVPLPDLLQLFHTSKKNGILVIRTEDDVGKIYLRKGEVVFAVINDAEGVLPLKSIYRMLTWSRGNFDLDPPDERTFPTEVSLSVQEILMEGIRHLDEFNRIRAELPSLTSRFVLDMPFKAKLRDLSGDELDTLELVLQYGRPDVVLNKSDRTDADTLEALLKMIKSGYLRPER